MARERLDKALFRVARETDVDELRLRRWVSFLALCGVLQRAIDEGVIADYHLKGGAALELRFADRARTTKDMDVGLPGNTRRDRFAALERAAALGFDEFTFRVKVPHDLERVDTVRVDVAIAYRGRGFQTIQIDLGPADEPTVDLVAPTIRGVAELGIPVTSPVRCITLDIQIAQKLHASTNPRVVEGENRARDILDVVFIDMLGQLDPKAVQSACVRVFEQRADHAWPPSINIPPARVIPRALRLRAFSEVSWSSVAVSRRRLLTRLSLLTLRARCSLMAKNRKGCASSPTPDMWDNRMCKEANEDAQSIRLGLLVLRSYRATQNVRLGT